MTTDQDKLRDDLRALLAFPAIGIPDYAADPMVGRLVGRMIADAQTRHRARLSRKDTRTPLLDPMLFRIRAS